MYLLRELTLLRSTFALLDRARDSIFDHQQPAMVNCPDTESLCLHHLGAQVYMISCQTRILTQFMAVSNCCDRRSEDHHEDRERLEDERAALYAQGEAERRGPFTCICQKGKYQKYKVKDGYRQAECVDEEELVGVPMIPMNLPKKKLFGLIGPRPGTVNPGVYVSCVDTYGGY